jgi:hypothetical protein
VNATRGTRLRALLCPFLCPFLCATAATLGLAGSSRAETPVTFTLDSVVYADNTEFFGPFRDGETILGSTQRLYADIRASDRATVRIGVFLLERAGSGSPVERGLPVFSLALGTPRQRFVLGTLDTGQRTSGMGPDRTTPHGLLPPLAVETLWFNRAYEAGLQWVTTTDRFSQESWFDYQKMNTAAHRELFDGGSVGRVRLSSPLALVYQWHVVHHGGQQFHDGPVSDSIAAGPGLLVEAVLPVVGKTSFETYVLTAWDRPDREDESLNLLGQSVFMRLAAERRRWRGHVIVWRGEDFKHEDGDANYLSRYPDGTNYVGIRDYSEAGLARLFKPSPTIDFETSVRLHLIERQWGYSYRLMATIHLPLGRTSIP